MEYILTQKEVWDRLRKRPYVISYLQYHKILFKAIEALRKYPTSKFYHDEINHKRYVDSLFRDTWIFDKAKHLNGWDLMSNWHIYYQSKNEL